MTCTEMYGSGVRIGMMVITMRIRLIRTRLDLVRAPAVLYGAVAGTSVPTTAVRLIGATTSPSTSMTASASASSVFRLELEVRRCIKEESNGFG